MEQIHNIVDTAQNFLWSYLNIELLILCALYFTWRTGFVQFRLLGEMFRIVVHGDKTDNEKKDTGMKHISSFHAFIVALASRIGTGNMAGVATAIFVGGPGAVFWMWVSGCLGMSTKACAIILGQRFRVKYSDSMDEYMCDRSFVMRNALGWRKGAFLLAIACFTLGPWTCSVQTESVVAYGTVPVKGERK